jgi:hypothetical protein
MNFQIKSAAGLRRLAVLSVCLATLPVLRLQAATPQFWVSTAASGTNGIGTQARPFDGSTATNFSRVLGNLPTNAILHILAGTYQTYGNTWDNQGWNLKTGQQIIGSGIDVTILQLVPNLPDGTVVLASLGSGVSNVVVSNLTCDANYVSGNKVTYNGVYLVGSRNTVSNVKVINLAHYGGNSESWGIHLGSVFSSSTASVANLIEGCEVSQFKGFAEGSAITAIAINGTNGAPASGTIRNNKIYLTAVPDNSQHAIGVGSDCVVQGNYVEAAGEGVYSDTGLEGTVKLTVTQNTFKNVIFGVSLRTFKQNVLISAYTITLSTNNCLQYAFWLPHDSGYFVEDPKICYTNVTITGNTVKYDTTPPPNTYLDLFLQAVQVSGLTVSNNKIEGSLRNSFVNCSGVSLSNNLDLQGHAVPDLTPVKPPVGVHVSH